jgi:predicted acylesterase/phospholipase RssA
MSEPIHLKDKDPVVDKKTIGISYSGGGPLVLIELGCAQAFIDKKIVPAHIAGVSAGSFAGTAHALDPIDGKGIEMAIDLLSGIKATDLGFGWVSIGERLIAEREKFTSLADHRKVAPMVREAIQARFGAPFTLGTFAARGLPALHVAATNRLNGDSYWFGDDVPIELALLASSSIPGVFPWQTPTINAVELVLVDGGVVTNQPISTLALAGCGTIFVCAVGYAGGVAPRPTNAIDNVMPSISMMVHQTMKLEEEYVRLKLGDAGDIYHIHPEVTTPISGYNFNRQQVMTVIEESRRLTVEWLTDDLHL